MFVKHNPSPRKHLRPVPIPYRKAHKLVIRIHQVFAMPGAVFPGVHDALYGALVPGNIFRRTAPGKAGPGKPLPDAGTVGTHVTHHAALGLVGGVSDGGGLELNLQTKGGSGAEDFVAAGAAFRPDSVYPVEGFESEGVEVLAIGGGRGVVGFGDNVVVRLTGEEVVFATESEQGDE